MSGLRPHLGSAAWLTGGPVPVILQMLDRDGEEARVVGGAVRNELIGQPVHEVDVATTALPDEVLRRAKAAHLRAVPTGIEHGTVTLLSDGFPVEVTTLREDVETYGRKAKVEFGRDWRRDAERRDFTINALSVSRDGVVHDYVGGLADLDARRVRFIGDASERIAEDYLRILRFFRFYAAYGEGAPDAAALHACIVARDGLNTLSRERVRMELLRLLLARRAADAIGIMADAGLMGMILGGVPYLPSFAKMIAIETAMAETPDAIRRLGALSASIAEDAERLFERLRLSNAERDRLRSMAEGWRSFGTALTGQAARVLLYRAGPAGFTDRVLLGWSRSQDSADDPRWRALGALPENWQPPSCPIVAADLMARGVPQGPELGAALRAAESAWMDADFTADAQVLAAIADRAAAEHRA